MPRRARLAPHTCVVVIFGQMKNRSQSIAASAKRPSSSAASVAKSLQCKRLRRQTWCECAICEGNKIHTPAIELCGMFVTQIARVICENNLETYKTKNTKWTQQLWRSDATEWIRGRKEVVFGFQGERQLCATTKFSTKMSRSEH